MERKHLAIHGTGNPEGVTRIELVLNRDGSLDLLHSPEGGGKFARVIRAFVGAGRLPKPIAVKLERDTIRVDEGAVKFVSEYKAQLLAHEDLKEDDRTRIVRLFEMWNLPPGRDCDELPPTLICPHSRQILPPRCPCGCAELPSGLRCAECGAKHTAAEVRAASGCSTCAAAHTPCKLYWLNERSCKILLLELLDLNLEDYLAWRWTPPASPPLQRPAWQKFQEEHLAAWAERERRLGLMGDPVTREFDELRFLLGLFTDALAGVRELHAKLLAHLDLKPANLCLSLEGTAAKLKVIDLGQAYGPSIPWSVWFQSVSNDAAVSLPGSQFLAPEQMPARFIPINVFWRQVGEMHYFVLPPLAPIPKSVLRGDLFCFPPSIQGDRFLRILSGQETAAGYEIKAVAVGSGAGGAKVVGPTTPQVLTDGCLVHQAGYAADLFALGMLLAHLVARGRIDLGPTRAALVELETYLEQLLVGEDPLPARAAVHFLGQIPNRAVADPWQQFLASLPEDRQLREITRELLGMALRAIIRGIPGFSYAADRSAEKSCLDDFLADLQTVRNRLRIHFQSHDLHAGRVARLRRAGLSKLRDWLRTQPPGSVDSQPPPYDRELICYALDMLTGNEERNEREFRLLRRHYRMDTRQLERDIDLFEKELNAHLVAARHVHPVVLGLFEVVSPPRNKKRDSSEVAEWKSYLHQADLLLATIRTFLARFDNAKRRAFLVEADMGQLRQALAELTTLCGHLSGSGKKLTSWQARFYKRQQQKIVGWDRLDFGGMAEWHKFGTQCWKLLSSEIKSARRWVARAGAAERTLAALIALVHTELINSWDVVKKNYAWSMRGVLRRAQTVLLGREKTTLVELTASQLSRLTEQLTATEKALQTTQAVPFADRLADTTRVATVLRTLDRHPTTHPVRGKRHDTAVPPDDSPQPQRYDPPGE